MSGLAALSECDRVILRAFQGKSVVTSLFYCHFSGGTNMRNKKIAALVLAVALSAAVFTACTKQSDEKKTESTAAQSSALSSEEKDCCSKEDNCCEDS